MFTATLTATELIEIYDVINGRASTESERESIARLVEIVGNEPEKWVAALAAHALSTAALARDAHDKITAEAVEGMSRIGQETRAALSLLSEFSAAAEAAAQAAASDITEARSEAVSLAAREALASLSRVIPSKLTEEAAKIAAIEAARFAEAGKTSVRIIAAIWTAIGFGAGLALPVLWRSL
jgi:hypothetical protein